MELALRTARALDASGAQVVVLARAGQDLSRWGLEWSHLGLAYRDGERWLVAHKLNACGSDRADLWRQGLAQFFLDDPHRHEAAWTVPTPAVQQALLQALRDPTRLVAMHEPRYSMVAYPWSSRYQQSNQWVVETLAAALEGRVADRAQAQARLAALGWRPPELRIDAMERVGAQLGNASIAFDDHPPTRRLAGRIATTSADAALRWLQDSGLAGPLQRLGP
jgi:hypothetical protein